MKVIFRLLSKLLIIILVFSCTQNKELQIIRDSGYDVLTPHLKERINNITTFGLYERYFVFGYNNNKSKFDSIINKMICLKINEKELLSRIDITFEDYGKYSTYEEGEILSSDFTKTIVSVVWDIEDPHKLKTEWGENHDQKFIHFKCVFKPEYKKILDKQKI
jgi:hypothetical protein